MLMKMIHDSNRVNQMRKTGKVQIKLLMHNVTKTKRSFKLVLIFIAKFSKWFFINITPWRVKIHIFMIHTHIEKKNRWRHFNFIRGSCQYYKGFWTLFSDLLSAHWYFITIQSSYMLSTCWKINSNVLHKSITAPVEVEFPLPCIQVYPGVCILSLHCVLLVINISFFLSGF